MDFIWLVLHFSHFGKELFQKKEFRSRIYYILISNMWRDPFFSNILKDKILVKLFNLILPNGFIKNILMKLLDFRSSLSYII